MVDKNKFNAPEYYQGQEKKHFDGVAQVDKVQEAKDFGTICKGVISQVDKDKAYVEYKGVRGVIPKEALDTRSLSGLVGFVGRPISFVIKGYDKENSIFVASRVEALELMRTTTLEELKEGQVRPGTIVRVDQWGCLLDLGGVLGRLSVADMFHTYVEDPRDVFKPGDYFDVMVKKVSKNAEGNDRVTVSLKDLIPAPWAKVPEKYKTGDVCLGKISGFLDKAVFVELEPGVEGLADLPGFDLKVGQRVRARIGRIDTKRNRIRVQVLGIVAYNN